MAASYHLAVHGKTAFESIDGRQYCIWRYRLVADTPAQFREQTGIRLPADIDVKDPAAYPEVSELHDVHLDKTAGEDWQYVYADVSSVVGSPIRELSLSFIAPCSETSHLEVAHAERVADGIWTHSSFVEARDGDAGASGLRGPAPDSGAKPADGGGGVRPSDPKGTLPYASEEFGIYQPLIGWWSAQHWSRLADAAGRSFVRAVDLAPRAGRLAVDQPLPELKAPIALDRTDTRVGSCMAESASEQQAPQTRKTNLSGALSSSLPSSIERALAQDNSAADPRGHPSADTLEASAAAREVTSAQLLQQISRESPALLAQIFEPRTPAWQQALQSATWMAEKHAPLDAFLSPIGILHRFREYFFEIGTFLGPPVGHVWISPGGTVELVEVNTRKTLTERTTEQSAETVQKTELSTTEQDEVSDAIKLENASDTKLGVTVSASGKAGSVFQASASASFSMGNSRKQAQEQTHKRMREQSSKLSGEVRQNYKTTFRTVTETTDTSSRRYVLQNTTPRLVSYELSRKMRKVAVQVQDLGLQLCWHIYVDNPGDALGLGEFVHEAMGLTDPALKPPDDPPPPGPIPQVFSNVVDFIDRSKSQNSRTDLPYIPVPEFPDHGRNSVGAGHDSIIEFHFAFEAPAPPPGYTLSRIESIAFKGEAAATSEGLSPPNPNPETNTFAFRLTSANFHDQPSIGFDITLIYMPTQATKDAAVAAHLKAQQDYQAEQARVQNANFYKALRERLKKVGQVKARPANDLRDEERDVIYRRIITKLFGITSDSDARDMSNEDYHVAAELVRYMFDVDALLYFVAPDWWRPRVQRLESVKSQGEIQPTVLTDDRPNGLGKVRAGWGRPDYLITEETAAAPEGSSLGWLIQFDGDAHRNAFLNSPWVKAVLPIRPGREREALAWLKRPHVEDVTGLAQPYPYDPAADPPEYQGRTVGDVLLMVADQIAEENRTSMEPVPVATVLGKSEMALPSETVFSHGFDPLDGGINFGDKPFKVFSQWMEVLPTDQVVATEYDLKGL